MKLTIHFTKRNEYTNYLYTRLFDLQRGHILYTTSTIIYQLSVDTEENREVLRQIYFEVTLEPNKKKNGVISVHLTE